MSPKKRSRWNPAPLRVEPLEDRLAPAFDLILSLDPTLGVTRTVTGNTAKYEATATGANLDWSDVAGDLASGLNVVVTSGSGGTESGNVTDTVGIVIANAIGTSLEVRSGTGVNLVGNVTLTNVRLTGEDSSILVAAANDVSVGVLDGDAGAPLELVTLTTSGGAVAGGTIVANNLFVSALDGVGAPGTPLLTQVSNLEAVTEFVGIFIENVGDLTIGNVTPGLNGIAVGTSGDVVLETTGSLFVTVDDVFIFGPDAVTVRATVDVFTGGDNGFFNPPFGAIGSESGSVLIEAGRDIVLGDGVNNRFGDVTGFGVTLLADRHVIVTADTGVVARGTSDLIVVAGGDVRLEPPAGGFGPSLTTEGGDIFIVASGDFVAEGGVESSGVDSATEGAAGGNVSITAANLFIGDVIFAGDGNVTLIATVGLIVDTTLGENRLFANELFATAVTGISLETSVNRLTATVIDSGDLFIDEEEGLIVVNATTFDGSILIFATGDVLVEHVESLDDSADHSIVIESEEGNVTVETITAGSNSDVTITAIGGSIFDDGDNSTRITGGTLTLIADRAIGQPGATGQIDTNVSTLEAGTFGDGPFIGAPTPGIWVADLNDLTVVSATTVDGVVLLDAGNNLVVEEVVAGGTGRNVRLRALDGDLTIGQVSALGDTVLLIVTGAILSDNDSDPNVVAGRLSMIAGTGIGLSGSLMTEVGQLAWFSDQGGIDLVNNGPLTISDVTAFGITVEGGSGAGHANVMTTSPLVVASSVFMGGAIEFIAGETDDAPTWQDTLTVEAGVTIESLSSSVSLLAGDDLILEDGATVQAATDLLLIAGFDDEDDRGGVMLDGTLIAGGDLTIGALDDVVLGILSAVNGTVSLHSVNGAISSNNSMATNVVALDLAMRATTGIGDADTGIKTEVSRLEAQTDTGGIFVVNLGDLAIGGVTPSPIVGDLSGVHVTTSGDLIIETTGDLTLATPGDTVSGPGTIELLAEGVLTISQNVVGTSDEAGRDVILVGFSGVTINNGAIIANNNLLGINVDVSGAGSAAHVEGVILEGAAIDADTGDVRINGTGFTGVPDAIGIRITNSSVQAFGGGTILLEGFGGSGNQANSVGIVLDDGTLVSVENGDLSILGASGSDAAGGIGVMVLNDTLILATGSGAILITGDSQDGDLNPGIVIAGDAVVSANTGEVGLIADEMDFFLGAEISGNGNLRIEQRSTDRGISLGADDNQPGQLSLTQTDLAALGTNFALVTIGHSDGTGTVTVDGDVALDSDLILQTPAAGSGGIHVMATLSVGTNGALLLSGSNVTTSGAGLIEAEALGIFAVTGIGAPGDPVQTKVTFLEAVTTTGGVYVHNQQDLTIGGVILSLSGIEVIESGDVEITASSSLTIAEDVITNDGNVLLVAQDSASPGDDVLVLANVEISSNGGDVSLLAGDNLIIASSAKIMTSGAGMILLQVDAGNADPGVGGVAMFSGDSLIAPGGATVLGNSDNDTFTFSPSANTPITVNGAAPLTAPGDTLNLDLSGTLGGTLQITEKHQATASFTTTQNVEIVSIEQFNVTNGAFDLLLDLAQASLNGTAFGNGNLSPDAVRLSRNAAGNLLIDVAQDGSFAFTDYFRVMQAGIRSVSFAGSSDQTNFLLVETAAGLPTFAGTAIGSHDDSGALPPGTFTVPNVGFNWTGGTTGQDTLSLNLLTNHAIEYFADLVNGSGGNVELANLLRLSFQNLGELTFAGNTGALLADASLVNATTLTIADDETPNDGTSRISGDGGFTNVRFSGFNQILVRGGTGSQVITLDALDALDTALQTVILSGDNVFGTDTADDVLNVNSLLPGRVVILVGGAGNDTFNVVPGVITIFGGSGDNRLVVDASAIATPQNVILSNNQIQGGENFNVIYLAEGGSYADGVELKTGDGADVVIVNSIAGPTSINTGAGNDTIRIQGNRPLAQLLNGALSIDAGEGSNTLLIFDVENRVGRVYNVDKNAVRSAGVLINFVATDGEYEQLTVVAGRGNDRINVLARGAKRVTVNGFAGNDVIRVIVSINNPVTGLFVSGGAGFDTLRTLSQTPGALIRNIPTGALRGFIQVSYQANQPTRYQYGAINQVLGINASANYVTALYRHVLGRNPIASEIGFWVNVLNTQGRLGLVRGLESTVEAQRFLVQRWFLQFLGRLPTQAEAAPLVSALTQGQSEEVVLGQLLGSPGLPQTAAFRGVMVTEFYKDLFNRNPTPAELQSFVNSTLSLQAIRFQLAVSDFFFRAGV